MVQFASCFVPLSCCLDFLHEAHFRRMTTIPFPARRPVHAQSYPATDSRLHAACRPDGGAGDGHAQGAGGGRAVAAGVRCLSRRRLVVAAGTVFFVLRPIRMLARDAPQIAQGNLEHRVEWSSRDSFGVIAGELNRIAVRLRELRDSEAGRRQMEFQLSDAVLQSIFEPIIVTDGKGHVLKVNQAAAELLGEAATDRMALANTPGGDKILSAIRDAVSMQKAVAAEDEASHAAHAHRQAGAQLPAAHHAHARLRRAAAGHRHHARRRNQPAGHRPLQDAVHHRGQPQAARPAAAVAPRPLRAGPGLWRRAAPVAGGTGGRGQQRIRKAGRPDGRPDRSGRAGHRQARVQAGAHAPAAGSERGPRPLLRRSRRRSTFASRSRPMPISRSSRPTGARCAPFWTICSRMQFATRRPKARFCWPPKRSRTLCSSRCAIPAAASRPSG